MSDEIVVQGNVSLIKLTRKGLDDSVKTKVFDLDLKLCLERTDKEVKSVAKELGISYAWAEAVRYFRSLVRHYSEDAENTLIEKAKQNLPVPNMYEWARGC